MRRTLQTIRRWQRGGSQARACILLFALHGCGDLRRDPSGRSISGAMADAAWDSAGDAAAAEAPLATVVEISTPVANFSTRYTFDEGLEDWTDLRFEHYGVPPMSLAQSAARSLQGTRSLEVSVPGNDTGRLSRPTLGVNVWKIRDRLRPGAVIRFHVLLLDKTSLSAVQPFAMFFRRSRPGEPDWVGLKSTLLLESIVQGRWNVMDLRLPDDADVESVLEIGIELVPRGTEAVTLYVDDVSF